MISASQLPSPNISAAKLSGGDTKVVRILEINSELLKSVCVSTISWLADSFCFPRVCMEFQARGVPINDPRFGQYALFYSDIFPKKADQGTQKIFQPPTSKLDLVGISRRPAPM
jgi:hypothetical protein